MTWAEIQGCPGVLLWETRGWADWLRVWDRWRRGARSQQTGLCKTHGLRNHPESPVSQSN